MIENNAAEEITKVTPQKLAEMAFGEKTEKGGSEQKQLTPEYYGQCADAVYGKLQVLGPLIWAFRRNLLLARVRGDFECVISHKILLERVEIQYSQLKGLEEGLRLIAENQDPEPVITELVSDIERIVDFNEQRRKRKDK